jgi:tRNA pseudouridine55 synthase
LNVHKPAGMTSRRVVDLVQRLAAPAKAGHAGTLDPLASGVLVVCVGAATRLIEYVQQMRKSYAATFLLGRSSDTDDIEGEVVERDNAPVPTLAQLVEAAGRLTGEILQRPPAYSAVKIKGRRAYDLARRGEAVALEPRRVIVYRIEIEAYAYPELRMRVDCGSGTYIRALGRDLAASLGTAAVMSQLVRTAIGAFSLAEAVDPYSLTAENWRRALLPPLRAVEHLPQIALSGDEVARLRRGQTIARSGDYPAGQHMAGVGPDGALAAIVARCGPGRLGPLRTFAPDG